MARILSHPFRLARDGTVATVEQTDDQAHAEQLAVVIATRRGERPLAPTFGITDPAFGTVDAAELAASVATFGPPVTIAEVAVDYTTPGVAAITVAFE